MQQNRSNTGALVGGAILIALGLLSLTGQLFRALDWSFFWPFTVIGFGALFFVGMLFGGKQLAALAIPGSIICGIGMVLLFQNITHHWETWSYFWTLIILFVGVGIYISGWLSRNESQKQSGFRVMKIGFILFVIFGLFFEALFSRFNNFLVPVALIGLGAYLVLARAGLFGGKKNEAADSLPPTN